MSAMRRTRPLFGWLVDGAPGCTTAPEVIERMGHEFRKGGLPIDRMGVFVTTLHPTILGRAFYWTPDGPLQIRELTRQLQESPTFQNSPVARVPVTKTEIRRVLDRGLAPDDFPLLHELAGEGFTDFVCFPVVFTQGQTHAITFATRHPSGFLGEDIAELRDVLRPLARITEIFALRRVATNLLDTYVGRHSGEKILSGRIFKGDIEDIRAVIWFSDLRGFTEMSAGLTPRQIIDTLNELFDCQVPAIERHGGEVLKFIGDGLLAIFAVAGADAAPAACEAALAAADEAFAALSARNERGGTIGRPIDFGLALHVGEIAHGNIGGASRLDFTVIGPAVNLAARLEGLTGRLGRKMVVSSAFAENAGRPFTDVGAFDLKGVPGKQRVLAPA